MEVVSDAIYETMKIIDELGTLKVPAREISDALGYFMGSTQLWLESSPGANQGYRRLMGHGIKPDYFEKLLQQLSEIEPGKLREVAARYLNTKNMIVIVLGPAEDLRSKLSGLGPIEVIEFGSD
jgi:predicted Zn-dependent peptidase